MKCLPKFVVLGVATVGFLALAGCSGTIPVNYTPHNIVRYQGDVDVGQFSYAPAKAGKVKTNQVANTAVGSIYLPTNVSDLVRRATAAELEKTGFKLDTSSPLRLTGTILNFEADDLGYSVDWSYAIRYVITNVLNGKQLLSKKYSADPVKTGKFGQASDYSSSINNLILSAYTKFIRDPMVKEIFTSKSTMPNAATSDK